MIGCGSRPRWATAQLAAVVGIALIAYGWTACPYVLGGDNGEFATLFARGGVAHPPGFPLYVVLLRCMRWIPASNPAHGAALVSAWLGAAGVYVLQRACLAWGASARATALCSAAYAFTPVCWKLSTHAEVFVLNQLIAAAILWASAPGVWPSRARYKVCCLSLLAGLGLSNHPSIVLVAPVGLWAIILAIGASRTKGRDLSLAAACLTAGLLPYVYLLDQARHADPQRAWVWGHFGDVRGVWRHFLRADYGTLRLASSEDAPQPVLQLRTLATSLFTQTRGLLLVVPLLALVRAAARRRWDGLGALRRGAFWALAATAILAGPIFVMCFNIAPRALARFIVERFYLLPMLPLCILGACTIDCATRDVSLLGKRLIEGLLLCVVLVGGIVLSYEDVREEGRPTVQLYVLNLLRQCPPHAIVLGDGDQKFGSVLYAQHALELRPDVDFIAPKLMLPWYAERVGRRVGMDLAHFGGSLSAIDLAERLLPLGRPVFFAGQSDDASMRRLSTYPIGTLLRVLPKGEPVPDPDTVFRLNLEALAGFDLEEEMTPNPDTWAGSLGREYARPWSALELAFRGQGKDSKANDCRVRSLAFQPWKAAEVHP